MVSYTVQEYFISGASELFAEIVGLMGLLLGWSILGKLQFAVQEYFITGASELFAEIGGLMGLLLGWSILRSAIKIKCDKFNKKHMC